MFKNLFRGGGTEETSRLFPFFYFLIIRIIVFIYNTPFISYILNHIIFGPIKKVFEEIMKPFSFIYKIFKKILEPITKPFSRIWDIIKKILFFPYYLIKFLWNNFKVLMQDILNIISKGHNLLEMYILTNSILYKFGIVFNSESNIKRLIYLGIIFFNLVIIGYNNYNSKIINPIFSVIEQILFGTTFFTKAMTKNDKTTNTKTFTEAYDKYAFAIFPIIITLILLKASDCGVIPLKEKIPYIRLPIPFIGAIITPLINKLIKMTDIEFIYIYVLIRFIIYFMFQLPIRINNESQKITESISKLSPVIKNILNVVKIIYYIMNPLALFINRINKDNIKIVGRTFSSILSIVSLISIVLYYNDHKYMKYLTLLEQKICEGIDMYDNMDNINMDNMNMDNMNIDNMNNMADEYYDNY